MIDSNLFQQIVSDTLPGPEHVYLETNFDLLGESSLGEHRLDLGHNCGVDHPTLWSYGVHFLSDSADDGKILWEICCQNSGDSVSVQIFKLGHF